jgi:nucleoside-triphosphatase THEP1
MHHHHDSESFAIPASPCYTRACILLAQRRPGTGKTTAIRHVVNTLGDRAGGFHGRELWAAGRQTGFELVNLDRQTARSACQ